MAGFTIEEALVAATKTSAEILYMDELLGTLEAGKLADVVVIDGNLDEHLENWARANIVVRDCHVLVRDGQVVIPRHQMIKRKGKGQ